MRRLNQRDSTWRLRLQRSAPALRVRRSWRLRSRNFWAPGLLHHNPREPVPATLRMLEMRSWQAGLAEERGKGCLATDGFAQYQYNERRALRLRTQFENAPQRRMPRNRERDWSNVTARTARGSQYCVLRFDVFRRVLD